MKYIEELTPGDCFVFKNDYWVLTIDFKNNDKRLCYNLKSGSPSWLNSDNMIDPIQIYTMDKDNTILPIKETKKENEIAKSTL